MLQLDYLSDSNFLGVNRLFILPFDVSNSRIGHLKFYLPIEKVGGYNVMIHERNVFDQPDKNYIKNMIIFLKIITCQEDAYTTDCTLEYKFFKYVIK